MITWIRSATIAPGKTGEAFAFVRSATKLIKHKHNIMIAVGRPIAGNPNRVFWRSEHADMAEYEADHRKISTDGEFLQIMREAGPCFVAETTHDEILQSV